MGGGVIVAGRSKGRRPRPLPDGVDVPAESDEWDASRDDPDARRRENVQVTKHGQWQRFVSAGAIPVADGIKAKTRRGRIGQTWWSQRFLAVIESLQLGGRLDRARTYARKGQVTELDVDAGRITARVQGSRKRPYRVRIELPALGAKDWDRAIDALASRAAYRATLLAGEMPDDVEDAFEECHVSLFPTSSNDLSMDCTCPDWSVPCKHIGAVLYLLAESFDEDPFLLFLWRGLTKDELLTRIRSRRQETSVHRQSSAKRSPSERAARAASSKAKVPELRDRLDDFWGPLESGTEPGSRADQVRLVHALPELVQDPLEFACATEPAAERLQELLAKPAFRVLMRAGSKRAVKLATKQLSD